MQALNISSLLLTTITRSTFVCYTTIYKCMLHVQKTHPSPFFSTLPWTSSRLIGTLSKLSPLLAQSALSTIEFKADLLELRNTNSLVHNWLHRTEDWCKQPLPLDIRPIWLYWSYQLADFIPENTSFSLDMDSFIQDLVPSSLPCTAKPLLRSPVLFLQTYQQHSHALCGFHALFNALTYLKGGEQGLCSGWKFWKTHNRLVAFLLREAGLSAQECAKLQDSGPLERHQMVYILAHYPPIQPFSPQVHWVPLYFAFGRFQMSLEELQSATSALQAWRRKETRKVVFLLGITNHWSVLLYEWLEDTAQVVYLDSKNKPEVFSALDTDVTRLIATENALRLAKGLQPMTPYQVKMRKQHTNDLQTAISRIGEVAAGHSCFASFLLTQEIQALQESYAALSVQHQGATLVRLWVLEAFQPISQAITELMHLAEATHLHPASSPSLLEWLDRLLPWMTEQLLEGVEGDETRADLKALFERFPALVARLGVEKC